MGQVFLRFFLSPVLIMTFPPKYIAAFVFVMVAFFGYNAWLIQRDTKMFDAYYGQRYEQLKK